MKKTVIIYKSKTGFTQKYAQIAAQELGCTLLELKDASAKIMSEYDTVVFGGGLHAGTINGLKKAKEMFRQSSATQLVVFATGGTPNAAEEIVEKVWTDNLTPEEMLSIPHYYMQSGMCYEKMQLPDKALMKMAAIMLSKKQDKDSYETGFEQAIRESYDISSREYVEPMIQYLREA